MGYDPTDYFDFGADNQNGSVKTRFGSKTELVSLITKVHGENMKVYIDLWGILVGFQQQQTKE